MATLQDQIKRLFSDVDPEVRQLVDKVISIEVEFLHLENPVGIKDEIAKAINSVVIATTPREDRDEN